jgi:thiazole synthase
VFTLYGKEFRSRFILGTSRYPSLKILEESLKQSEVEIVTVSLRRQSPEESGGAHFWNLIKSLNLQVLPNTAGCYSVQEAVATAHMAREFFKTNWIKLEVIGDENTLMPNSLLTVQAAKQLVSDGFCVFPYITDDIVIAKELVRIGCQVLMPWASPIGSGRGIVFPENIKLMKDYFSQQTIIVDAGIGAPSHAALALELGCDAVLLNTAVACAHDPIAMADAFRKSILAGRQAYLAGLMPKTNFAQASTPIIGVPFS